MGSRLMMTTATCITPTMDPAHRDLNLGPPGALSTRNATRTQAPYCGKHRRTPLDESNPGRAGRDHHFRLAAAVICRCDNVKSAGPSGACVDGGIKN